MYDEQDDAYLVMCRNLDNLLKIDRSSGEIVWEMGGANEDFGGFEGGGWSHGHMSHFWGGGMLVFDNGYHHEPQRSRVVEYSIDEQTRAVGLAWNYWDPEDRFIPLLGDARRLAGGNTLVSWTSAGMLTEVTPSNGVVWRARAPAGTAIGRARWVEDLYDLR